MIVMKKKVKKKEVEEVYFNVDNDIPLRLLVIRYCDYIGVNHDKTSFEFNGARLREPDRPLQLSMLPSDVISAYTYQCGRGSVNFATICISMYKRKDTFLRVRRAAPLLPQLMRGLSDVGPQEESSICFVQTADYLDIEDGDIVDAINFDECSSSLSIIKSRLSLKVINNETSQHRMFTVKRSTCMSLLMNRYCKMEGLDCLDNSVSFLHEGADWTDGFKDSGGGTTGGW